MTQLSCCVVLCCVMLCSVKSISCSHLTILIHTSNIVIVISSSNCLCLHCCMFVSDHLQRQTDMNFCQLSCFLLPSTDFMQKSCGCQMPSLSFCFTHCPFPSNSKKLSINLSQMVILFLLSHCISLPLFCFSNTPLAFHSH